MMSIIISLNCFQIYFSQRLTRLRESHSIFHRLKDCNSIFVAYTKALAYVSSLREKLKDFKEKMFFNIVVQYIPSYHTNTTIRILPSS